MSEISASIERRLSQRLGFLFEGSPWIAAEAWDSRPWRTREALHAALLEVVARASQERQLALIRAHPDLVGRAALAGTLTRESTAEQRAAGLDPDVLSEEEIAWFQDANAHTRPDSASRSSSAPGTIRRRPSRPGSSRGWAMTAARRSRRRCARSGRSPGIASAMSYEDDLATPGADATGGDTDYTFEVSYGKHGVPVYRVFRNAIARCRAHSRVVVHRARQQSARLRSRRRGLRR